MAYWWETDPAERSWVEIRKVPGTGVDLNCSVTNDAGNEPGQYKLVGEVRAGDVIYHWHAAQSRFIGRSTAATDAAVIEDQRIVPLRDFNPLIGDVDLAAIRAAEGDIYELRDELQDRFPEQTLYLPFQFRSDGLRMVNYYFAKMPKVLVERLFGASGWADEEAADAPAEEGESVAVEESGITRAYLQPFRPKADTEYQARVGAQVQKRGRTHETLVNDFSDWLTAQGLTPGRNRAIDIGIAVPSVIIEAKIVKSWPQATRQPVGQLYECKYFQVVPPDSKLVFLASKEVPHEWRDYLERDRDISVAWREGTGFALSKSCRDAFGLS
jgi:hypothetical protein